MPFCPQCGIDNPANARFCDQCGAVLIPVSGAPVSAPVSVAVPPIAPALPATATAAPAVPITSGGVICPQCGAAAIPGEAFCDNCGAPLNAPGARPVTQSPLPAYNAGVPPQPSYPAPQPSSYAPSVPTDRSLSPPPMQVPPPVVPVAPVQPVQPPPVAAAPARNTLASTQLVVASSGVALPLPGAAQAIIGRGDPVSNFYPDIDLNPYGALDNGVGRRHARLFVQGGQVMIEDLDSTNGTLLNSQKLTPRQPMPVRNGDQIVIGKLLLRFQG